MMIRFCTSPLWCKQALQEPFPAAIEERDFVIPGDGFSSNDARKNLTDLQETSQWLGGVQVPRMILAAMCALPFIGR